MILYLFSPLLYKLISKAKSKALMCLFISIASLLILFLLCDAFGDSNLAFTYENNSFAYFSFLNQLPCFVLGMLLWFSVDETLHNRFDEKKLKMSCTITCFLGFLLMLFSIFIFFYPGNKYAIFLKATLVGLSTYFILKGLILMEKASNKKPLGVIKQKMLIIGRDSFYIYLVHPLLIWIFCPLCKKVITSFGFDWNNGFVFLILLIVVIALTICFAKLYKLSLNKIIKVLIKRTNN